jgi:hypothetical protein
MTTQTTLLGELVLKASEECGINADLWEILVLYPQALKILGDRARELVFVRLRENVFIYDLNAMQVIKGGERLGYGFPSRYHSSYPEADDLIFESFGLNVHSVPYHWKIHNGSVWFQTIAFPGRKSDSENAWFRTLVDNGKWKTGVINALQIHPSLYWLDVSHALISKAPLADRL